MNILNKTNKWLKKYRPNDIMVLFTLAILTVSKASGLYNTDIYRNMNIWVVSRPTAISQRKDKVLWPLNASHCSRHCWWRHREKVAVVVCGSRSYTCRLLWLPVIAPPDSNRQPPITSVKKVFQNFSAWPNVIQWIVRTLHCHQFIDLFEHFFHDCMNLNKRYRGKADGGKTAPGQYHSPFDSRFEGVRDYR